MEEKFNKDAAPGPGGTPELLKEVSGELYRKELDKLIPPGESEREKEIQRELSQAILDREYTGVPMTNLEKTQLEYEIRKKFANPENQETSPKE